VEDLNRRDGTIATKALRKVLLLFELTACKIAATGRTHVLHQMYTNSSHESAKLRRTLEGWRGRAYTLGESMKITDFLGKSCLVSVKHIAGKGEGQVFASIDNVSPPMAGITTPPATRALICFEIGVHPLPDLSGLPWLFGKPVEQWIKESPERKALQGRSPAADGATNGTTANGASPAPTTPGMATTADGTEVPF
jgi:hypothetical protein